MGLRGIAPFALIALVAVLAAGCTDAADGSGSSSPSAPTSVATSAPTSPATSSSTSVPPPTTSSTPRPSTSSPSVATTGPNVRPGEKPPTLPALAKQHNRLGAVAFAEYWFQALDWGYATTDSTLPRTLYLPQCTDCIRFMHNYDDARAKHEYLLGSRISIHQALLVFDDHRHPGTTPVDVQISASKLRIVDGAGKTISSAAATPKTTYRLWLKWSASQWKVLDTKEVVFK